MEFQRIKRLPPYVFSIIDGMKMEARHRGEDIVDFGMGNPDLPTPPHVVAKLIEAASKPANHRYSVSRGIYKLRVAIAKWYQRRYGVTIDPDSEAIVTIGAKEGLSHLAWATIDPGDVVLCPSPTYPIHQYAVVLAGGDLRCIPLTTSEEFFGHLDEAIRQTWPKPKMLIISFPHNPTTQVVELDFFEKVVKAAKEHNFLVVHDLAYADLTFDGYQAPSFLQAAGAKDVGVEFFSLSKSYNMPGWRVGFCVGNKEIVQALARIKSYFDYGIFQPIQIAAIHALDGPQECVEEICSMYQKRRDSLLDGLDRAGWHIPRPKGTMFVWAEIPEPAKKMGSVEFCKYLLQEAQVAVSPGIGFGQYGDDHVRFALDRERAPHQAGRAQNQEGTRQTARLSVVVISK